MSVNVGNATGYLDLDINGFLRGLKTAQSEANNSAKKIETSLSKNLTGIGNKLTSSGKSLTKSLTVPIAGAGAAVVKMSSDFESAMSKVQAVSGASGKELLSLNKKAQQLGATTAYSATEVANGMTEMAKAGWNSQQIMDGMEGVLNAASASGENLASVSTIVADAITGFRMEAKEATKVADLLTQAANSGTIDITDLGESFKYVAPIAGSMGLSIEDVTTALSAMSMAGIKGSQAGTSLRTMLTRMVKPTGAVKAAMNELGISVTNQDGSMKSLDEIVSNLRTSFDGLTQSEKAKYAATLAGQEGMSGMLALLNLTEEEYDALSESMKNCDGVAKQTAETMLNNLKGQVTILKSSLEGLAIQFGEVLLPYLKKFNDWLQKLVLKLQELTPEQKEQIVKWAAFAAAIGPVLLIIGKIVSVAGTLIGVYSKIPGVINVVQTAFLNVSEAMTLAKAGFPAMGAEASKLGVVLSGVTAPIMAIIAVIALLIAAFVSLWKNNEEFRNNIIAIWNEIKQTFSNFTQGIVDRLNELGFEFESITDVIKTIWNGLCNILAPLFEGSFKAISIIFKTATDMILNILDLFISIFKGDWSGAWEAIKNIFSTQWNGIKEFFLNILNVIKNIFLAVWNGIKSVISNIIDGIKTKITNTWNNIKNSISNIINSIKSTISKVFNSIKSTVGNIVGGIKSTISSGFNAAKNVASRVFNSIKSKISSVMNSAKNIVSSAINKIKGFFNFSWSLPKLKLPHISITGKFSLHPPSVPKFGISWYKSAMENGMILNAATIFGYNNKTGKFLGAGESGSETVVGTNSLMKMINKAVITALKPIINAVYKLTEATLELGYITYDSFSKHRKAFEEFIDVNDDKNSHIKGDTFNFYSPKSLTPMESARQLKKAKRELELGF